MVPRKQPRKALFVKDLRPVPPHIQELRKRRDQEKEKLDLKTNKVTRIYQSSTPHVPRSIGMDWLAHDNKIRAMEKEIRTWEKEGMVRSRGLKAMARIASAWKAYQRLRRMKSKSKARKQLSDLALLRELNQMGKLDLQETRLMRFLEEKERGNQRKLKQK